MDLESRAFVRRGNALVPADMMADEMLREIPDGREVLVTVRRPRSPRNHAHFFAILHRALEHMPESCQIFDERTLLDAIKLAVGHVRRVRTLNGITLEMPDSIDFSSMPEDRFQRFKARALYILGQVIGCDPADLEPEDQKRRAA